MAMMISYYCLTKRHIKYMIPQREIKYITSKVLKLEIKYISKLNKNSMFKLIHRNCNSIFVLSLIKLDTMSISEDQYKLVK